MYVARRPGIVTPCLVAKFARDLGRMLYLRSYGIEDVEVTYEREIDASESDAIGLGYDDEERVHKLLHREIGKDDGGGPEPHNREIHYTTYYDHTGRRVDELDAMDACVSLAVNVVYFCDGTWHAFDSSTGTYDDVSEHDLPTGVTNIR